MENGSSELPPNIEIQIPEPSIITPNTEKVLKQKKIKPSSS